ncbi:glycosyltransferase [Pseudomonas helleri]|uniref:Glycosyltransferase n=1 Tax=Pseudomonas helleri TaxID=1608996 RepID=A0A7X1W8L0_9PSED|nr:glycosyltransferase family 1 protein [Pseudomonas helleri]MQT47217.1 glycosyltransferase [Pseudomonas helleri]
MKVLMGTESLRPPLTGIGNYTLNLLREFQALPAIDVVDCFDGDRFSPAAEVLKGHDRPSQPVSAVGPGGGWKSKLRGSLRSLPLAYRLKAACSESRFRQGGRTRQDFVYHEPNFILKPHDGPSVTTVHDLSFVSHPQFHPAERVAWLNRQLPRTLERADFVITDSEIVRAQLIKTFSVAPDRVAAIYLGADSRFVPRTQEAAQSVLAKYNLVHGRYLAFVGTIEPRKGLSVLLDAWERLPAVLRRNWPLVIAGAPGWRNADLIARIQALQAKDEVRFLQFVSSDDLPFIYAGAATFIYPSFYEGFGLPVLEAMASGVPVICGAGTSMAEFTDGACRLFDVEDAGALALAISELIEDPALRSRMEHDGQSRASQFSWSRCAQETLQAYIKASSSA